MASPPFVVLIPARLSSTRLPHKPLADLAGLPMVVRVAQRALASNATQVVVAADHERIVDACQAHGIQALLTRDDHVSGSDRLAEAASLLRLPDEALVLNVQGDEPLIEPALIDAVADVKSGAVRRRGQTIRLGKPARRRDDRVHRLSRCSNCQAQQRRPNRDEFFHDTTLHRLAPPKLGQPP